MDSIYYQKPWPSQWREGSRVMQPLPLLGVLIKPGGKPSPPFTIRGFVVSYGINVQLKPDNQGGGAHNGYNLAIS